MLIDRKFEKAAMFAAAGAILTFFGLIHSEAIGFGRTPALAGAYMIVAVILYVCGKKAFILPASNIAHEQPAT
jgi:AGZA family xanthine/uracil permease-like MFS transporter